MSTMCVQCLQRPEEGLDLLEQKLLQMLLNCRVGAGNGTPVLCKSSEFS